MALYKHSVKPSAGKELEACPFKVRPLTRIVARIAALAANPQPHGSEKLAGYDDRYRVRQGNYRVVYEIDDDTSHVTIYKIGHRREVYRQASYDNLSLILERAMPFASSRYGGLVLMR